MSTVVENSSPDRSADALFSGVLDPLRYDGHSDDPHEVAGILRELMPENVRVLDVGCGTGSVTVIANAGKQNNIFGVEPDRQRSNRARARGLTVHTGFLEDDELKCLGKFDVVVLADVLEHLVEPKFILVRASAMMTSSGIVLASIPNVAHWSVRLKLLFGRFDYEDSGICDATHLRWFTTKSAKSLVNNSGFVVNEVRYTSGKNMKVYGHPLFKVLPLKIRKGLINLLTACMPRLFACQVVLRAHRKETM